MMFVPAEAFTGAENLGYLRLVDVGLCDQLEGARQIDRRILVG